MSKAFNPMPLLWCVLFLAFTFFYPRALMLVYEPQSPWASFFYMYGNGLVFFGFGLSCILRSKACHLGRGRDSFWFNVLIVVFVFFASLHAIWIGLAQNLPFKG